MVVHVDLTKTENYGIPCCSNHPYYRKGNVSTKQVQVTCFKNGTHTMYLHNTLNKANIGSITHTNYANTFNQHTDTLGNKTINEVAVIYFSNDSSTAIPILVLLNEKPTPGDSSTTHGYYYQNHESTRGDVFTQFTFKSTNGCNMMGVLKGKSKSQFNSCEQKQMDPIREIWQQITKDEMIQAPGSPVADIETTNCQKPNNSEFELDKSTDNDRAEESPNSQSQESSRSHEDDEDEDDGDFEMYDESEDENYSEEENEKEEEVEDSPKDQSLPSPKTDHSDSTPSHRTGTPNDGGTPRNGPFRGHPDLKVYTLEKDVAWPNDSSKFEVSTGTDTFIYKFRPGAECVKVTFKHNTVWAHEPSEHGNNYPQEVSYYPRFDRLTVYMGSAWSYTYSFIIRSWFLYNADLTGKPAELTPPRVRNIIYAPEGDDDLTLELYEDAFVRESQATSESSTPKTSSVKGEESPAPLDAPSPSANGGLPSERTYSERTLKEQPVSEDGSVLKEPEPTPPSPKRPAYQGHQDLKVYTLDGNVARANDTTKFDLTLGTHTFIYKLKEGAECVEVRFRNKSLWVHDSNAHGDNYPCEVSYYGDFDVIYVYMDDSWVYTYSFKIFTWVLDKINLRGRPATLAPAPVRRITYEPESAATVTGPELPRGKEVTEHPDISITSYKKLGDSSVDNKGHYRVFDHANTLTFWFHDGAKCQKVEGRGALVWKHSVSEYQAHYPRFVVFTKKGNRVEIVFSFEWYYLYFLKPSSKKWELRDSKLVMKPGELPELLKRAFNITLSVSPSTLSYLSGMSISSISFFMYFSSSLDARFRSLIDKLYYSDMCWKSLSGIVSSPDHLCKLLDMVKGTSFSLEEARLHALIGNPELLIHLIKELKAIGFYVDELLKTLIASPEKLKKLLSKMKEFGYSLNLTEIRRLGRDPDLLAYLKSGPLPDDALEEPGAGVGGTLSEPAPAAAADEGGTEAQETEPAPEPATPQTAAGGTGSDGEAGEAVSTPEVQEGVLQKAADFIEKHKTEISASSGAVVSVGVVGTVGAVVYNKFMVGTAAAAAAALI